MEDGIFRLLQKKTQGFTFSEVRNEPKTGSEKELHEFRLKTLINEVRQMAVRKFSQMPKSFELFQSKDDWIQEAMVLLYKLCSSYQAEKGHFNNYVKFMISRRLTDIQRDIFRKNPLVREELRKVIATLKREKKRQPTVREITDITGLSENKIQDFLDGKNRERVFTDRKETDKNPTDENNQEKDEISAEEMYIRKEIHLILWKCIEQLESLIKMIVMLHEFENMSFPNLFENHNVFNCESAKTFERRYKDKAYSDLQRCIEKNYKFCHKSEVVND